MGVVVLENEASVIDRLWQNIELAAKEAIQRDGRFYIGLSGGSLIKYLASGADKCTTEWAKWQLFFCDERFVPESDEDSTYGQYKELFVSKTNLTLEQFVVIDTSLSLTECAKDYERKVREGLAHQKVR